MVRRFHSQDRWAVVGLVESDWLIFKSNDDDYGEIKGFQEAFRIPLGKGITGRVAATGKAELIADVSQDPDYVSIEGEPTRSECVLPLKIHGQTIGVLDVQSRKVNDFSDDDFQIYSSLATHLAIALDNALTHQRLRAHTKQIESLHEKRRTEYQAEIKRQQKLLEINHQANRQQSLSDTARVIVEGLRELGFDRAGVFIKETASEGVHGLWGTDSDGNIYQNEDEFLTTDDIPPTDGYYVEVDAPELKEIFGRGQSGGFLSRDRDDGIFESIWGYPPPCPGYYRRSEHGDNISLCAAVENERICIMAVDNHITKRQIDEVSANLLSLVATHLGQALANASLRESLEESEIRNQAMLTAIPDLMFRVSKDGVLLDYKTSKDNLAIAPDGLLGQNLYEVLPTEYARRTMHYMNQALQTGEVQIHEYQIALPQSSDNIRDFEARTVVSGEDETLTIVRDITEQKLAEAKIKASLKEKESLLQEIHHRVKNNLQIIISLLDLQLESRTDPKVLAALQGSQHRIRSMALVHEQLYQSENLAEIDFAQYIHDLVYNLFDAYQVPLNTITLKFSVD